MRGWALRGMHGPRESASDTILRNNYARRGRKRSHNNRRPRQEWIASRSEGMDADQRPAMRLLPGGTNHAGGGAVEQQKENCRLRNPLGDGWEQLARGTVHADSHSD